MAIDAAFGVGSHIVAEAAPAAMQWLNDSFDSIYRPAADDATFTLYRGMPYYDAAQTVENQALDADRIAANQRANPGAAGSGAYTTTQPQTAGYYADLAAGNGRAGGPAVVQMDIPVHKWKNFVERNNIQVETEIPRGPAPGATETLIPMAHIPEFNEITDFSIYEP